MKEIPLTRGKVALVDDKDFAKVSQFKWYAQSVKNKNGPVLFYAARRLPSQEGKKLVLLHRILLNAGSREEVDHINHDTLDCRRNNLRRGTSQQNSWNAVKTRATTTSRFKGVCRVSARCNRTNPWLAYIGGAGSKTRRRYLGYFSTEHAAAQAYDLVAGKLFGVWAQLNYP